MSTRKKKPTRRHRKTTKIKEPLPPIHPWRICPYGEHWVRTHPLHVPPRDEPLDPNLVKALIFTESRFDPTTLAKRTDKNSARGLMQVTNKSREIMANTDGEVTDHYIAVTREELNDPNTNICAGVRKRLWGTRYSCIMGSDPAIRTKPPERLKISWVFEAIRTQKGCESYFQQCDLDDLIKNHQCKPSPLLGPIRLPPGRAF